MSLSDLQVLFVLTHRRFHAGYQSLVCLTLVKQTARRVKTTHPDIVERNLVIADELLPNDLPNKYANCCPAAVSWRDRRGTSFLGPAARLLEYRGLAATASKRKFRDLAGRGVTSEGS